MQWTRRRRLSIIRDYRRLQVWRRAHDLTIEIYRATSSFPDYEGFGLIARLRASVVSIEANIAEGSGRRTASDYGRFLDIALGSAHETECHLMIARDLCFLPTRSAESLLKDIDEIRRMLIGLRRRFPTPSRP